MEEFNEFILGPWFYDNKEFEHDPMKLIIVNDQLIPSYELIGMDKSEAEQISFDNKMKVLRKMRDKLLEKTDWTAIKSTETGEISQDWINYRQSLRDITNTVTTLEDFQNFQFPNQPS